MIIRKRIMCIILIIGIIIGNISFPIKSYAVISSIKAGDNISAVLSSDGTLSFTGSGNMYEYEYNRSPWYNNTDVKKVVINEGITSLGKYTFSGCKNLTEITFPNEFISIGSTAFYQSGLTKIEIPKGVSKISSNTFYGCSKLVKVVLPSSITDIESGAFWGCSGLSTIQISENVKTIGQGAFYKCTGLSEITMPESVNWLQTEAFSGCSKLNKVTIYNPKINFDLRVFDDCDSDLTIYANNDSSAKTYAMENGLFFKALDKEDEDGDGILDGEGTEENPYRINSASAFLKINENINAYYSLTRDISLPAISDKAYVKSFSGTFNGNGYSISTAGKPLFYELNKSARIQDFKLILRGHTIGISQDDNTNFGVVVSRNSGVIEKIETEGSVIQSSAGWVGGIVGTNLDNGIVRRCHNNINFTIENLNANLTSNIIGGIVADFVGGTITECWNSGDISLTLRDAIQSTPQGNRNGGIVGMHSGSVKNVLKECVNNGNISTSYDVLIGSFNASSCIGFITSNEYCKMTYSTKEDDHSVQGTGCFIGESCKINLNVNNFVYDIYSCNKKITAMDVKYPSKTDAEIQEWWDSLWNSDVINTFSIDESKNVNVGELVSLKGQVICSSNDYLKRVLKSIKWESDDKDVADVGEFTYNISTSNNKLATYSLGMFVKKEGNVIISGEAEDGTKVTCKVIVGPRPEYTISGTIVSQDGIGLSNVLVELYVSNSLFGTTKTDNSGNYEFTHIFKDQYKLKASADGYKDYEYSNINLKENMIIDITMRFNDDSEEENQEEFTMGRDNNSFGNASEYFFSTNETQNYSINSMKYRSALYDGQDSNSIDLMLLKQFEKWGGSCFGISLSMMYAYYGGISLKAYLLDEQSAPYYNYMAFPVLKMISRDLIQVFHLSQYRSDMSYTDVVNKSFAYEHFGIGSDLKNFLKELVKKAEVSDYKYPFLFGIQYKGGGHALLVCGVDGMKNGYYNVEICDPNYRDDFVYLKVKSDYSDFYMEDKNGTKLYVDKIDKNNFKEMKYVTYEDVYKHSKSYSSKKNDKCRIIADNAFYMTTDSGDYLSYDGESFTGTVQVDSAYSIINEDENESGNVQWVIELSGANALEFKKLADTINIDCLFDSDEYINVSGNKLSSVRFEDNQGVDIQGDNSEYTVTMDIKDEKNTLLQISGLVENEVSYTYGEEENVIVDGINDLSEIKINGITDDGIIDLDEKKQDFMHVEDSKSNISLSIKMQETANIKYGTSIQLIAEIVPSGETVESLLWSSDKPDVAIVDQNGLVTAVGVGNATIIVQSKQDSNLKASCVVTVTKVSGDGNSGENNSTGDNTSSGGTTGGSTSGGGSSSGSSSGGGSTGGNSSGSSSSGGNSSGNGTDNSNGNLSGDNDKPDDSMQIKLLYYIVEFNANGGSKLSRKTMTLLNDDNLGILPKVQCENYIFNGWYTQKSGGTKVSSSTVLNAGTTLFARWTKVDKPSNVKAPSLKSKKAGQLAVSFKKITGTKGYEIVYSTNKKFPSSSTKKVVSASAKKTLKKLKSGKKYYVRVRAYKTDSTGKKVYGAYSEIRSIKVK